MEEDFGGVTRSSVPFNLLVRSFHIQTDASHVIQKIQKIHNSIYFRFLLSNTLKKKKLENLKIKKNYKNPKKN